MSEPFDTGSHSMLVDAFFFWPFFLAIPILVIKAIWVTVTPWTWGRRWRAMLDASERMSNARFVEVLKANGTLETCTDGDGNQPWRPAGAKEEAAEAARKRAEYEKVSAARFAKYGF